MSNWLVTEPGIYDDIPERQYHADTELAPHLGRSLSASGAKTLLKSPERFAYEREHGRPATDSMDTGTLVHALVLRGGDTRLRVIDAYNWRKPEHQQTRKEYREQGLVPCHRGELLAASEVARAVRHHPLAGGIFAKGRPEVSIYWIDTATGITCRGRIDWVHDKALVDLKTVGRYGGAEPETFGRQSANLEYPMSAAHYIDGWLTLTGELLPFITVTVEIDPPHFITVGQYLDEDLEAGRARMTAAKEEFARRESSGEWSDPPQIVTIPVPAWYSRAYQGVSL
jgi:hypothetical protein